jgi:hypothetical protein
MKNILYLLFLLLTLNACGNKTQTQHQDKQTATIATNIPVEPILISDATQSASGPYLTKDHQGNIVLSWIQAQDSLDNYLLTYAVSTDGGISFSTPKAIATSKGIYPHDENLSKLIYKPNGDLLAMFAVSNPNPENSYAGLVMYTQSFDGGKTWTQARQLAKDTINSIDERYFDIALLPNREIGAVWLDSRKDTEKEGSSLYYSATQGRTGFEGEKVIDRQTCQCCRTDLYVDGKGALHVAYRAILNDSIRDMMYVISRDIGKTFSKPKRISADNWIIKGCPHTGPSMASNDSGLHFSWYTMGSGNGVFYASADEQGQTFSPRENISALPSAKHPQMATLPDNRLAIVWDERENADDINTYRIGLQLRNKEGKAMHTGFIHSDSLITTHPVISVAGEDRMVVAYTKKGKKLNGIYYQVISNKVLLTNENI